MSTTKWLLDNDFVQRCADCDFYPCSNTREDVFASNDCDMFTHEEEEMLDEDDLPETWQEFLDNFGIIMLAGGEANLVVPKGRVKQMMELYHDPVVRDLDKFIQACEELHDIPAEDEILRLTKENDRLREIAGTCASIANHMCDRWDNCEYCPFGRYGENMRRKCELGVANDALKELGIEIKDGDELMAEREGWNEQGH